MVRGKVTARTDRKVVVWLRCCYHPRPAMKECRAWKLQMENRNRIPVYRIPSSRDCAGRKREILLGHSSSVLRLVFLACSHLFPGASANQRHFHRRDKAKSSPDEQTERGAQGSKRLWQIIDCLMNPSLKYNVNLSGQLICSDFGPSSTGMSHKAIQC